MSIEKKMKKKLDDRQFFSPPKVEKYQPVHFVSDEVSRVLLLLSSILEEAGGKVRLGMSINERIDVWAHWLEAEIVLRHKLQKAGIKFTEYTEKIS